MTRSYRNLDTFRTRRRSREQGRVGIIVLVAFAFALGLGGGIWWFHRPAAIADSASAASRATVSLSEGTKAVLKGLETPVTIRFYSLLDPASVSASLNKFAARVDQLVSAYESEGKGKIKLTRVDSRSSDPAASAAAASADGIKPFNLDKGDACFLGLTVSQQGPKETIPQLSPQWEQALESDLTRAIIRVASGKPTAKPGPATEQVDAAAVAEVKRAIPDLAAVSLQEGTQLLRQKALNDFAMAAQEMEARIKETQQRISQAQNNASPVDQQAALKEVQQIQSEQTEKLKQIAARLQAQIAALEQIKKK